MRNVIGGAGAFCPREEKKQAYNLSSNYWQVVIKWKELAQAE
jgi:hypothetical protein